MFDPGIRLNVKVGESARTCNLFLIWPLIREPCLTHVSASSKTKAFPLLIAFFALFFDVQNFWPQMYRGSDNVGHFVAFQLSIKTPQNLKGLNNESKSQTYISKWLKVSTCLARKCRQFFLKGCSCQNCPKQISSWWWFTIKQSKLWCQSSTWVWDDIWAAVITRTLS